MSALTDEEVVPVVEPELEIPPHLQRARSVLRHGLHESPELRKGLGFTVVISLGVTVAELITPILVKRTSTTGSPTASRRRTC